jgi:hypothetical protein
LFDHDYSSEEENTNRSSSLADSISVETDEENDLVKRDTFNNEFEI